VADAFSSQNNDAPVDVKFRSTDGTFRDLVSPHKTATQDIYNSCQYIDKEALKSVGPAHYHPKIKLTHRSMGRGAGAVWSNSTTRRLSLHKEGAPGPGDYQQYQTSISVKQIQNLLSAEGSKAVVNHTEPRGNV